MSKRVYEFDITLWYLTIQYFLTTSKTKMVCDLDMSKEEIWFISLYAAFGL